MTQNDSEDRCTKKKPAAGKIESREKLSRGKFDREKKSSKRTKHWQVEYTIQGPSPSGCLNDSN